MIVTGKYKFSHDVSEHLRNADLELLPLLSPTEIKVDKIVQS